MEEYVYVGLVSCLALLVYYFTMLKAGMARGRFGVEAPAHEGPEEYNRYVRAHQNTLEHLVLFLPGLWLFAVAVDPLWAAGIGAVWPVARLMYALGYYRAVQQRMPGLLISMPIIYVLVLGALVGFLIELM
jgi:glutathione S-transferase